ncbi:cation:proton antiporter [Nocardioides sp. DS6]|uniref:Cation:proton antiporter n=1 Tax=Nocardioides eburneus TaxID=3231482 RepID=A0ABV3T287_9ACTN
MSGVDVVAAVLLGAGALVLVIGALGLVVRRDVRDRIHYASLVAVLGAPLVVVGLALTAGSWHPALKLLLIGVLLAGTGPVLSTVTGRAVERSTGPGREGVRER